MNKFELVKQIVSERHKDGQSLLDVGCRGCELKDYVKGLVTYSGVDLFQNKEGSVNYVVDVEKGLPFEDDTYDFVVALDLVEHLNDFQKGLEELIRVVKGSLIIMLPNVTYLPFRTHFLIDGSFSGLTDKYDLIYGKGQDRHRWLTVIPQMDNYMRSFAESSQVHVEIIWFNDSKKKKLFEKIGRLLRLSPSWWVMASLYIFTKRR